MQRSKAVLAIAQKRQLQGMGSGRQRIQRQPIRRVSNIAPLSLCFHPDSCTFIVRHRYTKPAALRLNRDLISNIAAVMGKALPRHIIKAQQTLFRNQFPVLALDMNTKIAQQIAPLHIGPAAKGQDHFDPVLPSGCQGTQSRWHDL